MQEIVFGDCLSLSVTALGEEPKRGKKRDQGNLGMNYHWKIKRQSNKRGLFHICRWLVSTLAQASPVPQAFPSSQTPFVTIFLGEERSTLCA